MCVEFWDEILSKDGRMEDSRKFQFSEKGQNRNFGKNPEFSRSRMKKRISPLESSREI